MTDRTIGAQQKREGLREWMVMAILAVCTGILLCDTANSPFNLSRAGNFDQQVFKYIGRLIVSGGMPYVDLFDHKGPVLYLINALGVLIHPEWGIWLIEMVNLWITLFFGYKTLRLLKADRAQAAAGAVLGFYALRSVLEFGNLCEEYALPFQMVALWCFTDYLISGRLKPLRVAAAGACFGAVVLLRENLVALWVPCVLVIMIRMIMERKAAELGRCVLAFTGGLLCVAVPIMVWLAVRGAFGEFIRYYWTYNLLYSAEHGTVTFFDMLKQVCRWNLLFPAAAVLNVCLLPLLRKEQGMRTVLLNNLLCLAFSLVIVCLPGNDYSHYAMMLLPCMVIPFGLAIRVGVSLLKGRAGTAAMAAVCALLAVIVVVSGYRGMRNVRSFDGRTTTAANVYLKHWLRDGERVLTVGGPDVNLYNDTGTFYPGKFIFLPYPVPEDMQAEHAAWVEAIHQDPPEYLVSPLTTVHEVYYLGADPYFADFVELYSPVRIQENEVIYIRNDYYPQSVLYEEERAADDHV